MLCFYITYLNENAHTSIYLKISVKYQACWNKLQKKLSKWHDQILKQDFIVYSMWFGTGKPFDSEVQRFQFHAWWNSPISYNWYQSDSATSCIANKFLWCRILHILPRISIWINFFCRIFLGFLYLLMLYTFFAMGDRPRLPSKS